MHNNFRDLERYVAEEQMSGPHVHGRSQRGSRYFVMGIMRIPVCISRALRLRMIATTDKEMRLFLSGFR